MTASRHLSPLQQWGRDKPHTAAIQLAQADTRLDVPRMTMQLPEPEWRHESAGAATSLQHMLKSAGYPEEQANSAWVTRRDGHARASAVAYDPDSRSYGVALHPDRWDYGTLAHEAAHLVHHHGEKYDSMSGGRGDAFAHGAGFAQAYGHVLRNSFGPDAGDAFDQHYANSVRLVSNYRRRVHGLPGIEDSGAV